MSRKFDMTSPAGHHFTAFDDEGDVTTDRITPGKFEKDALFNNGADLYMPQYKFYEWDIYEVDESGKRMAEIRDEGPPQTAGPDYYGDAFIRTPEELAVRYPPGNPVDKWMEETVKRSLAVDSKQGYPDNTSLPPEIRQLSLAHQDVYRIAYNNARAASLPPEQAKAKAEQAMRTLGGRP